MDRLITPRPSRARPRHQLRSVTLSALLCGLVACGEGPTGPIRPGAPNVGTLVYSAAEIVHNSDMAWVGLDESIAFRSWDGEASYLKLLDLDTGQAAILDGPTSTFGGPASTSFRQVIARSDGERIYYVTIVGVARVLRHVGPQGGSPTTLDPSGGFGGMALAPGDGRLAYNRGASLVLLDLETMETTEIAEVGYPVSYSPDGSELLVMNDDDQGRSHLQLARLQLAEGTVEPLDLTVPDAEILAADWGRSGIRVLGHDDGALSAFGFPSGTGSAIRSPLGSVDEMVRGGALAPGGDAFAIWTEGCAGGGPVMGGCALPRFTVYVGAVAGGKATPIGSADTRYHAPALLFSRDGSRLYYSLGGMLYVVPVGG